MKRVFAVLAVLVFATAAFAQQSSAEGVVVRQTRVVQGQEGAPAPPDSNLVFIASESFSGKVVKGAPYSAEAVTETVQVLGDGNRIVNKFTSTVYRDSEGRTRREQTLKGLGVLGTGNDPLQTIFISDPVAHVTFSLDTRSRTAHKSTPFKFKMFPKRMVGEPEGGPFEFKIERGANSGNMIVTPPPGAAPPPSGARLALADTEHFTVGGGSGGSYVFRKGVNGNEVKQDLGKQMIEGVEAEGTRTTITIPAGSIGNERPIEIVSERWYSPELQLLVMSRHTDPRMGETTYKLTNINRSEPMKSLFEVPSDYTVREGNGLRDLPLPRVRKSANPEE